MFYIIMQITNSTTNFTSRNIDIRRADDIVRHANRVIPAFNPNYAAENWKIFQKSPLKKFYFEEKFKKLIFAMRNQYHSYSEQHPTFYLDLFDKVKSRKICNCNEKAFITLGTLFANGYDNAMKIGLEMEIGAYDKTSGKCIATKIIPIDHTTVLSTMNNPNRVEINKTVVLDGWLNKAMTVSEAKKEYERFVPKRKIEAAIQELQDELRASSRMPLQNRFARNANSQNPLDKYEFRKSIEFLEDIRFKDEKAHDFGQEVLRKYPQIKLNQLI